MFPTFPTRQTTATGVSDQRVKRKTAQLHTSDAKRAETSREGVKW